MNTTRLEWKAEFAIGVAAIDDEHRRLIELIAALCGQLQQEDARDPVVETLGEIYAQIAAHFALEERLMQDQGYEAYAEHKDDHERLLDDIRDIMDDYEVAGRLTEERLPERLDAWFGVHFRTHDARLHRRLH